MPGTGNLATCSELGKVSDRGREPQPPFSVLSKVALLASMTSVAYGFLGGRALLQS